MIKKDPIDVLIEKTDRLIQLTAEMLTHVTTRQDKPERKPYTRRESVDASKKARQVKMPREIFDSVSKLEVGEKLNLTTWMRANKVNYEGVRDRIYTFGYTQRRKNNDTKNYRTFKEGWDVFVERTI